MAVIDGSIVLHALQISNFDAQILAAAKRLGCAIAYSGDLNHGQDYGGVCAINPVL